jgi:hypothetical protein
MSTKRRKIHGESLIFSFLLFTVLNTSAQTQPVSEWSIHAGVGNSSLQYNLPDFIRSPGDGGLQSEIGENFGVRYSCFFSSYFGFSIGLEAAMYNSLLTINNLDIEQVTETPPGLAGTFFFRANYSMLKEKQSALFLQLPLMLQFQFPVGKQTFFYFGAGGKYGIPLSASYNPTVNSITTTGYSDYSRQVYQNMPNHGFTTYNNAVSSTQLTFKPSYTLSFESGFKWKISNRNSIYAGLYLDQGMNNIRQDLPVDQAKNNAGYSADYSYNSLLQTSIGDTPFINEIKPYAFGVKIRIAFGAGKLHGGTAVPPKSEPKPRPKSEPKPEPVPILPKPEPTL